MLRRFNVNRIVFFVLMDVGLTILTLHLATAVRPSLPPLPGLIALEEATVPSTLYVLLPLVWLTTFLVTSSYDPRRMLRVTDEVQSVVIGVGFAALVLTGLLYLFFRDVSRYLIITFVVLNIFALIGWRLCYRMVLRLWQPQNANRRVLIIGTGKTGQRVAEIVEQNHWMGITLVGFVDDASELAVNQWLGPLTSLKTKIAQHQIDDVIITLPNADSLKVNALIAELHSMPVTVRVVPDYLSLAVNQARAEEFGGVPTINLRLPALNAYQRFVKRLVDIVVSALILLITSPLLFVIMVAIKLDSEGPVLFRQCRIGENGQRFTMYKFRSMIEDADKLARRVAQSNTRGQLIHKKPDDPRITRVGRFLRRTSLDELPQFFNVLRGDMSLVGPRPELPWLASKYEPWQYARFAVPQGITGWWQVNGRSDKPMHLHTQDDLYYIQNYSLWLDFYILLKTPWVVLRGRGAY